MEILFRTFREAPLVSISTAQRCPLPFANFISTVHHGLPPHLLEASLHHEGYLAFLGRICPEKGLEAAVRIASASGMPLRIAAKVDEADQAYYDEKIRPWLRHPGLEFVGEISQQQMGRFLGGAAALLFPIDWPEPFGLVMIEAMACGTPVIAFDRGSVSEVVEHGISGFIAEDEAAAVAALERLAVEGGPPIARLYNENRGTGRDWKFPAALLVGSDDLLPIGYKYARDSTSAGRFGVEHRTLRLQSGESVSSTVNWGREKRGPGGAGDRTPPGDGHSFAARHVSYSEAGLSSGS
jgi:hypothetical protein